MAIEDEATSKKKVLKKEYGSTATTKLGMHKKAPAKRMPTSKPRKAALEETMEFTLEPKAAGECKKRKERVKKTTARVLGRSSMFKDPAEEEEEEEGAPTPKTQKLMGDAIKSGAATSKPKSAPKATAQAQKPIKPKRSTRNIPAEEKNKAPMPEVEEEDDEALVLRKLKPKIPDHNDTHPVAEDMHIRKDAGLRLWR